MKYNELLESIAKTFVTNNFSYSEGNRADALEKFNTALERADLPLSEADCPMSLKIIGWQKMIPASILLVKDNRYTVRAAEASAPPRKMLIEMSEKISERINPGRWLFAGSFNSGNYGWPVEFVFDSSKTQTDDNIIAAIRIACTTQDAVSVLSLIFGEDFVQAAEMSFEDRDELRMLAGGILPWERT